MQSSLFKPLSLLPSWFTASALALLPLACGAVSDAEVFPESTEALSQSLGESRESYPTEDPSEVNIDDGDNGCGAAYCITRGGEPGASEGLGICTCRCDGPSGTGPFCSCDEGFSCEHLIEDISLENRYLAGSYCMPQ